GMLAEAIEWGHGAGIRALEASAAVEAVVHLRRALEQLATLPASERMVEQEVSLRIALGSALIEIKGYAAPDVEQTFARAHVLCRDRGKTGQVYEALTGLYAFYQVRGPLSAACEIGEQLVQLAHQGNNKDWVVQAHRSLGWTLFCLGQLRPAREHLE